MWPMKTGKATYNPETNLMLSSRILTAKIEPFDSFWEGPEDVEKGDASFYQFYKHNYIPFLPKEKHAVILGVSCGAQSPNNRGDNCISQFVLGGTEGRRNFNRAWSKWRKSHHR